MQATFNAGTDVDANGDAETGRWARACSVADISEDAGTKVEIDGLPAIAVFKLDGQFHAIADLCTHGAASLSEGFVENGIVECPFHSGTFDIRTGQALTFPCTEAVRVFAVRVEGDEVLVRVDSLA
jgi:nitrite reductase/ring-hydroxylating ferredoxin subunit